MKICYVKKKVLLAALFIFMLAVIALVVFPRVSNYIAVKAGAGTDNWGLSFQEKGAQPIGNANADYLADFNTYYVGNPDEKVIYLTFDAGFENGQTAQILDVLKEQQVPAAFFLVGTYIKDHPDLVKRMVAEGHIVGNHTMHHPDMAQISDLESFQKELADTEALYQEVTGEEMPKFYRPPQGKFNEQNLTFAKDLGYTTVFWSLAYVDWYQDQQPTKEEAFEKLIPRIHPGAVVLLHSTSQTNADILAELLTKWKELGYTFRPISDLPQDAAVLPKN